VTLKVRLYAYVVGLHVLLGGALIWQRAALGWGLFPLELALVGSLTLGLRWIRIAMLPHEITVNLTDIIDSGEYGARYPLVGHREIDRVIGVYNRMLENLRNEHLRLGEQRGFLEQFLSVTPVGIVIFDFDGRISLSNPRAGALLMTSGQKLHGCALEELDSPLATELATLGEDETRMITDTASRRLRCRRSRFVDRGFNRSYILIEELTAELNRTERETYEKLIRMMSHEVMNTVAATNSLLESSRVYANELNNAEHRDDFVNALDVLITRNRNLGEFTRRFGDLVKLPEPHLEPCNVVELLAAMQTMFRAELAQREIELAIDADDGLPPIPMDRNQMEQVLINVLKNAVEAIDRNGRIEIRAQYDGANLDLRIFDTGCGLDAQTKDGLFTPFYTTKRHGQGLGLTLVREILTRHAWRFSLEPAGERTCFRIEMPSQR